MASPAGGMDIEKVAAETPQLIFKEYIDPSVGFEPFHGRSLAFRLGLSGEFLSPAVKVMAALYRTFEGMDASLVEINPFLQTEDGRLLALDAKINFDDNALYRHPELSRNCATSMKRTRSRSGLPATGSTTSAWTATSVAW